MQRKILILDVNVTVPIENNVFRARIDFEDAAAGRFEYYISLTIWYNINI